MEGSDITKPRQTMITSFAKESVYSKGKQCACYMVAAEVIHFSFNFSFYMEYDLHILYCAFQLFLQLNLHMLGMCKRS